MYLPYDIRNQVIQCMGTCFHYKDNVEAFFVSCGIDRNIAGQSRDQAKFVWTRNLLNVLDGLPNGFDLQRRIITELCKFKKLPDENVQNKDAALSTLRKLKELAIENSYYVEEARRDTKNRKIIAAEKEKIIAERADKLVDLKTLFYSGVTSVDRQEAGYTLEDLLERLFPLFEIEYRRSYKTETQQIDGHFRFEGFDYLVEAKWRKDQPNENEIGGFERKIRGFLLATPKGVVSQAILLANP